jgi:hypothetical protein
LVYFVNEHNQNIVARCNGKIIIIDTGKCRIPRLTVIDDIWSQGISHAYGGVLSALSAHYTLTPVPDTLTGNGREQLWVEREVVSALYATHQETIVDEEREILGDFSGY